MPSNPLAYLHVTDGGRTVRVICRSCGADESFTGPALRHRETERAAARIRAAHNGGDHEARGAA